MRGRQSGKAESFCCCGFLVVFVYVVVVVVWFGLFFPLVFCFIFLLKKNSSFIYLGLFIFASLVLIFVCLRFVYLLVCPSNS